MRPVSLTTAQQDSPTAPALSLGNYEIIQNLTLSSLNGAINNAVTSLTLSTGDGAMFPATGNFRINIDEELIIVGGRSGDVLNNLTRGAEGTTAASHADEAIVAQVLTREGLEYYLFESTAVGNRFIPIDLINPQSATFGGNSYAGVTAQTGYEQAYWAFIAANPGVLFGVAWIPPDASIKTQQIVIQQHSSTAGTFKFRASTKAIANAETMSPAGLIDCDYKEITNVANIRQDLAFTQYNETWAADDLIVVALKRLGGLEETNTGVVRVTRAYLKLA